MKIESTRRYRMSARAEAAARTAQAIMAAAVALWREQSLESITLEAIAERAGVTTRTVIRRFGSKEGVIEACIATDAAGLRGEREQAPLGDLDGALLLLVNHYERDGDVVLRTLALEDTIAAAKAVVEEGRAVHRDWCARLFAPYLPSADDSAYVTRLDAYVAATDLYLWKLVRRELGRSAEETARVMRTLIDGLINLQTDQN